MRPHPGRSRAEQEGVDLLMVLRISAAFAALALGSAMFAGEAGAQYYPAPSPQYLPPPPGPYRVAPPGYEDDETGDVGPGPSRAYPSSPSGPYAVRPQPSEPPRYN